MSARRKKKNDKEEKPKTYGICFWCGRPLYSFYGDCDHGGEFPTYEQMSVEQKLIYSNESSENLFGYEAVTSEMKRLLEHQYQAIEAIKSTGRQLLTSASLIVALIGILQIFNMQPTSIYLIVPYYVLFVISAALYIILVISCVEIIKPIELHGTTAPIWDEIYQKFINQKDQEEVYKQLISNYLNAFSKNEPIIGARTKLAIKACKLLPFIVVLLFMVSILPRLKP